MRSWKTITARIDDGLREYLNAVYEVFGLDIDYAQLVKIYGEGPQGPERKYGPSVCTGAIGKPRCAGILLGQRAIYDKPCSIRLNEWGAYTCWY